MSDRRSVFADTRSQGVIIHIGINLLCSGVLEFGQSNLYHTPARDVIWILRPSCGFFSSIQFTYCPSERLCCWFLLIANRSISDQKAVASPLSSQLATPYDLVYLHPRRLEQTYKEQCFFFWSCSGYAANISAPDWSNCYSFLNWRPQETEANIRRWTFLLLFCQWYTW